MATSVVRPRPSPAVMRKPLWWLLAGSTLAFALSFFAMGQLHELAHGVAAVLLGYPATVYASAVDSTPVGVLDSLTVTLAGPLFSLSLGLALLWAIRLAPGLGGRGAGRLFLIWFVLMNLYEFIGYLITAPFLAIGDIHQAVELFGWPVEANWVVAVVGVVCWVGLGRVATGLLLEAAGPNRSDVLPRLRMLGIFAWFAGLVLALFGSLAVEELAGYSAWTAVGAGSYVSLVLVFLRRVHPRPATEVHATPAVAAVLAVLLVLLLAAQRLWLLPGLHLGG